MTSLDDADVRALREHYRLAHAEGAESWASFVETPDPTEPRHLMVIALRLHESEAEARASACDDAAWDGVVSAGWMRRVWGRVRAHGAIEARGVVAPG